MRTCPSDSAIVVFAKVRGEYGFNIITTNFLDSITNQIPIKNLEDNLEVTAKKFAPATI